MVPKGISLPDEFLAKWKKSRFLTKCPRRPERSCGKLRRGSSKSIFPNIQKPIPEKKEVFCRKPLFGSGRFASSGKWHTKDIKYRVPCKVFMTC